MFALVNANKGIPFECTERFAAMLKQQSMSNNYHISSNRLQLHLHYYILLFPKGFTDVKSKGITSKNLKSSFPECSRYYWRNSLDLFHKYACFFWRMDHWYLDRVTSPKSRSEHLPGSGLVQNKNIMEVKTSDGSSTHSPTNIGLINDYVFISINNFQFTTF